MNDRIKHLIKKKKAIFQKQKESNTVDRSILSDIIFELSNAISFSKAKYHEGTKQPAYLHDLIPPFHRSSQNNSCIYEPLCRTVSFKNFFLPYAIKKSNKLDPEIRNAQIYASS